MKVLIRFLILIFIIPAFCTFPIEAVFLGIRWCFIGKFPEYPLFVMMGIKAAELTK